MELLITTSALALLGALVLLLALATAAGAAIAIRPALMDRLRALADRRIDTEHVAGALDRPRDADRWFYRYHRAYGVVVIGLAVFLLYFLAFGYHSPAWVSAFGADHRELVAMIIEVARIVLWLTSIAAIIVGTVVFVRPSALKNVERWANRWLSPRRISRDLDREYHPADTWASKHPRLAGTIAAVAAGAILMALLLQWGAITRTLA